MMLQASQDHLYADWVRKPQQPFKKFHSQRLLLTSQLFFVIRLETAYRPEFGLWRFSWMNWRMNLLRALGIH